MPSLTLDEFLRDEAIQRWNDLLRANGDMLRAKYLGSPLVPVGPVDLRNPPEAVRYAKATMDANGKWTWTDTIITNPPDDPAALRAALAKEERK